MIEALADRRPPSDFVDAIGSETPIMKLVERHLERLEEDKRSPATLGTYRLVAENLKKFLGGVRVSEASPARLDAAIRSMRTAHGATMAKQAKTILRGGLQLAVMANIISTNPARDVSPIRMKTPPNGAPALTVEQLRHLVKAVQAPSTAPSATSRIPSRCSSRRECAV